MISKPHETAMPHLDVFMTTGNQTAAAPQPRSAGCRVTIGMPVYNGERHIGRAIRSILAQTYRDFQLLVVDNASTDRTAEIVQDFARQDPRVILHRNPQNIGAHPNFNRAFTLSDTEYFKWAAHDDEIKPTYLETCIRILDADPTVALAHTFVEEIDDEGNVCRVYRPLPPEAAAPDRLDRFRGRVMRRGWCTELFSVMRSENVRTTKLLASFAAADLSFLTELTLTGRVVVAPEPLFRNRRHPLRYTDSVFEQALDKNKRRTILAWHDTSKRGHRWSYLHWWAFFLAYFPMIRRHIASRRERLRYYGVAFRWALRRNNRLDLAKDLLFLVSPGLHDRVVRQQHRRAAAKAKQAEAAAGPHDALSAAH
ncbi:MAG TPA: glycosyltransferase family 2 protein [Opitutaceae bacterium]